MPFDQSYPQSNSAYPPNSPALSSSPQPHSGSVSPFMRTSSYPQYSPFPTYSSDESKEKQRCPHPDCGKTFKDLKAHMLTHQTERPEKCPIATCEYHQKGFARK